jgi:signal transduction histidine kinase
MVININRPDLEGKSISIDYKDIKGKKFRKEMLQKIIKNNEAFVTYYYKNPKTNKIDKKLSYFKYYKPLNIIVASGTYLHKIQNIVDNYNKQIESVFQNSMLIFTIISLFLIIIIILLYRYIIKIISQEIEKYQKTIRKETNKVKRQLYFDNLTKLENRKLLVDKIKRKLFSNLIIIDIDGFKNINQFYDAKTGDIYLQKFAGLLKIFRKTQTTAMTIFRKSNYPNK